MLSPVFHMKMELEPLPPETSHPQHLTVAPSAPNGAFSLRCHQQLYSVWPVIRHLLCATLNGISDSLLLPENQHFSAAFVPYKCIVRGRVEYLSKGSIMNGPPPARTATGKRANGKSSSGCCATPRASRCPSRYSPAIPRTPQRWSAIHRASQPDLCRRDGSRAPGPAA